MLTASLLSWSVTDEQLILPKPPPPALADFTLFSLDKSFLLMNFPYNSKIYCEKNKSNKRTIQVVMKRQKTVSSTKSHDQCKCKPAAAINWLLLFWLLLMFVWIYCNKDFTHACKHRRTYLKLSCTLCFCSPESPSLILCRAEGCNWQMLFCFTYLICGKPKSSGRERPAVEVGCVWLGHPLILEKAASALLIFSWRNQCLYFLGYTSVHYYYYFLHFWFLTFKP